MGDGLENEVLFDRGAQYEPLRCDVDIDKSSGQSIECVTRMTLDKYEGWRNVIVRVKSIKLAVCLSKLTIQGVALPDNNCV